MTNKDYEVKFTYGLNDDAKYIREEVFMKEQGFKDEFDEQDKDSYHLVLYKGNEAVGTARTFLQNDTYIIGRVAVIQSMRKHHLGKKIINELESKIQELGGKTIALSAQSRVQGFYASLGYVAIGDEYMDEHCPHIKMIKQL